MAEATPTDKLFYQQSSPATGGQGFGRGGAAERVGYTVLGDLRRFVKIPKNKPTKTQWGRSRSEDVIKNVIFS